MATVIVSIRDQVRHRKRRFELPRDREVALLIDDLIYLYGLPAADPLGRPIRYSLVRKSNKQRLDPDLTLGHIGIRREEILLLQNPVARQLWPWVEKLVARVEQATLDERWDQAAEGLSKLELLKVESKKIDDLRARIPADARREPASPGFKILAEAALSSPLAVMAAVALIGGLVVVGGFLMTARPAQDEPPPAVTPSPETTALGRPTPTSGGPAGEGTADLALPPSAPIPTATARPPLAPEPLTITPLPDQSATVPPEASVPGSAAARNLTLLPTSGSPLVVSFVSSDQQASPGQLVTLTWSADADYVNLNLFRPGGETLLSERLPPVGEHVVTVPSDSKDWVYPAPDEPPTVTFTLVAYRGSTWYRAGLSIVVVED